jgi:hypothetical protein
MVWSYYFGINYALFAILWEVGSHLHELLLYGRVYTYQVAALLYYQKQQSLSL